jgi:pyruvate/2-oxoglutarate/acetoin dehydrogenase E1 component
MNRTVLESLNEGLLSALGQNTEVFLLGEDILDPYGGAFKVTRGCSTAYPSQVIPTPISEAGLAGVAAGMSLRGLRPVVEIMFGDFITLTMDQLVNHISKFRWMYHDSVRLPMVLRTPMGGRRGYGPTHSQSLEKLFMGIPEVTMAAPINFFDSTHPHEPGDLLAELILHTEDPVLFIENKLQYLLPLYAAEDLTDFEILRTTESQDECGCFPTYTLRLKGAPPPQLTLTAYGFMAELGRQAMLRLAYEEEIFTELVIPTRLVPVQLSEVIDSVRRTGKLVTLEEGNLTLGWGAEVLAQVSEHFSGEPLVTARVAALDLPVPAAPTLEHEVLPQVDDILQKVRKVVNHDR